MIWSTTTTATLYQYIGRGLLFPPNVILVWSLSTLVPLRTQWAGLRMNVFDQELAGQQAIIINTVLCNTTQQTLWLCALDYFLHKKKAKHHTAIIGGLDMLKHIF